MILTSESYGHNARAEAQAELERNTKMAKSLLVALVAGGQQNDWDYRRKCFEALGLGWEERIAGVTSHASRARLDLGEDGLEPTAGCYPMTEYEHQLLTELVDRPDAVWSSKGRELRQKFAHLVLPIEMEPSAVELAAREIDPTTGIEWITPSVTLGRIQLPPEK